MFILRVGLGVLVEYWLTVRLDRLIMASFI
jgi:hypothetical protein